MYFTGAPPPKGVDYIRQQVLYQETNLYLSAPAGYGKTHLLRKTIIPALRERYKKKCHVWITATTGVAARAIDGDTIHSAAGMGRFAGSASYLREKMSKTAVQRWQSVKCIIIEECSMLSAEQLGKMDAVARAIRGNSSFMGGVRLILVGDFCQLPPVNDITNNPNYKVGDDEDMKFITVPARYAFESPLWAAAQFQHLRLTHSWRHRDCPAIAKVLTAIRTATDAIPMEVYDMLSDRLASNAVHSRDCTHLVCTKAAAATFNKARTACLSGEKQKYAAVDATQVEVRCRSWVCSGLDCSQIVVLPLCGVLPCRAVYVSEFVRKMNWTNSRMGMTLCTVGCSHIQMMPQPMLTAMCSAVWLLHHTWSWLLGRRWVHGCMVLPIAVWVHERALSTMCCLFLYFPWYRS